MGPRRGGDEGAGHPGRVQHVSSGTPQLRVDIERERVYEMGLDEQVVKDALQIYLGSLYVNDVTLESRNWQVVVQAEPNSRDTLEDVKRLKIRAPNGLMVPLGGLIKVTPTDGPTKVNRYQKFPSADVNGFTIPTTISSAQAIEKLEALAKRNLPVQLTVEWTDMAFQEKAAASKELKVPGLFAFRGDTTLLVFGLSALLVFLVLAALYESWLLPLAVVLIVPLCLLCAAAGLIVTGLDLNVFTQIGLVVLVGLACKNAILIVEFAKQKREAGLPRYEAAKQAAKQRLRPILMTSFAFILGVLPLVTGTGAGAEMRRALGVAVFSGMLGVTIFGLFFTPVFYNVLQRVADRRHAKPTPAAAGKEMHPPAAA